jgi:hypothetical protein
MGKRFSSGLFCFALFIVFEPAFAQIEAVTQKDKALVRKSSSLRRARPRPWKTNIVTAVFWIGEQPSGNNLAPNRTSAWDKQWTKSYGGFDDPHPAIDVIISRENLHRSRTHITAHSLTTTMPIVAIDRKRRVLFRGFKKRTRVRLFPLAKTDGSRSPKAIESLMRNGKTRDHSERTTGNTCLTTNIRNPM